MRSFLVRFAIVAALLVGGHAHAFTISLAGLDVEPADGLIVIGFENTDTAAISSVTFDFTYIARAPSWSEELAIQIEHVPSGTSLRAGSFAPSFPMGADYCEDLFGLACDVDLGAPEDSSDPFTVSLTFALAVADGSGLWQLSIGEGFDDAVIPDGSFEDGSRVIVNPVPLPAAAWLFASALVGLGGLRRRRN